jgi:hypothetical protein
MTYLERRLRAERLLLLCRYDHHKFQPTFLAVITELERDIAWMNQQGSS